MGVRKTTSKVKGWGLDIMSPHILHNEALDCRHDLVRPDAAQDDHPTRTGTGEEVVKEGSHAFRRGGPTCSDLSA